MKNRYRKFVGLVLLFSLLSACNLVKRPTAELTAKINVNQTNGTTDTLFEFDASSSSNPKGEITKYHWVFGDGSEATEQVVSHQFKTHGIYTVSLSVIDVSGKKSNSSQDISVAPTRKELVQIATSTVQGNIDLYEALHADEASQAIQYLLYSSLSASAPVNPQTLAALFNLGAQPAQQGEGLKRLAEGFKLPRGTYELNELSGEWVQTATTSEFTMRYAMPAPVEIVIDWDVVKPTQLVSDGYDSFIEMPTDMLASMTVGAKEAAKLEAKVSWFDAPECGAILEPTKLELSGYFGVTSRASFEVTTTLTDSPSNTDTGSTKGFFEIASGDVSERIEWDISTTGEVKRYPKDDPYYQGCFTQYVVVDTVDVAFKTEYQVGETVESFALDITAQVVYEDDYPVAIDLEGKLLLNGAIAIEAKGRLDDSNGDGVPGENVTLTYADGSTESLEQFLKRMTVKAALRSLFSSSH